MSPATLRFDHAVLVVSDLVRATDDFARAGFTVTPGGEHGGGPTHNALIAFADDTYLELIAIRQPGLRRALGALGRLGLLGALARRRPPFERRFLPRLAAGEGLADFALVPTSFDEAVVAARGRGLAVDGPVPGARRRPDGQEVRWQLGIPVAGDLPFLCADVTPRALRVPAGRAREHANGAVGVAGVTVAVQALDASVGRYRALTGLDAGAAAAPELPGARAAALRLGETTITLAAPDGVGGDLGRHLRRRGDGPFALRLRAKAGTSHGGLGVGAIHGARLALTPG